MVALLLVEIGIPTVQYTNICIERMIPATMKTDVPNDIAHMTELGEDPPCPHCGAKNRSFCKMKMCAFPRNIDVHEDEDVGT
jgi:hypothetical protein